MKRELCQRCGFPVPSRLRDTGFCTVRCARQQAEADRRSTEMERDEQARYLAGAAEMPARKALIEMVGARVEDDKFRRAFAYALADFEIEVLRAASRQVSGQTDA